MAKRPLEGIRVLSQGIVWAGPYATMILADMGAEVIEIESIQHLNPTRTAFRHLPPIYATLPFGAVYANRDFSEGFWNRQAYFNYAKRNHLSMTVNLESQRGRQLFLELCKVSDVFLENNAAGVVERLKIDYDAVSAANPQIIMIRFPGYGITGPYKYFKGYGANVEAVVGHSILRGYRGSDPSTTSAIYHGDPSAGTHAAFAVIAALYHRQMTGEGQLIDMSQAEAVTHHIAHAFMDYSMNRRVQGPWGNRSPSEAPHDVYRCAGEDYWVAIAVGSDEEFAALCRVIGHPELAGDERFADAVRRYQNQDELRPIIEEWTETKSHYEAMHALQREGVPAGAVLKHTEMFNDPHLKERGYFVEITHPDAGTHLYPGVLGKLSKTPPTLGPAPMLGEHNEYVYKQLLGLSDGEYQQLLDDQIIGDVYLETAT